MKERIKRIVVDKILGLHDTPERIAWGVAIGFFVACTPTMGLQLPLYVTLAVLLRANKVSGIVPTWLVNPFTMVPVYWGCAWVGARLLGREPLGIDDVEAIIGDFSWSRLGHALWSLGAELWLGGCAVGLACGAIAYPLILRAVRGYRRSKRSAAPGPASEASSSGEGVGIGEGAQP